MGVNKSRFEKKCVHCTRGDVKFQEEDYSGAIVDYNTAIALDHCSANAFICRANVRYLNKDFAGVVSDCDKAFELNYHSAYAFLLRAYAKALLGERIVAIADYIKACNCFDDSEYCHVSSSAAIRYIDCLELVFDCNELDFKNSENSYYFAILGSAKSWLKDYQGALADYERSVMSNPENAIFYRFRAWGKLRLGDFQGAIEDCSLAININRDSAYIYYARAIARVFLLDDEGARTDLSEAIKINPNKSSFYRLLGHLKRYSFGDLQGALSEYSKAIQINPHDADLYCNRAETSIELFYFLDAVSDCLQAIELDPAAKNAFEIRDTAWNLNEKMPIPERDVIDLELELLDFQRAFSGCGKVFRISPENAIFYRFLGKYRERFYDSQGALAAYCKAIEINHEKTFLSQYCSDLETLHSQCRRDWERIQFGNLQEVVSGLSKAIAVSPEDADLYLVRATARFELGDVKGLLSDLSKAIEINPDDARLYGARGFFKSTLGDDEGALFDLSKAIQIDPKKLGFYRLRADLKRNSFDDLQGALSDYSKAIQINPRNAGLYLKRAEIKIRLHDFFGAVSDCLLALGINLSVACEYAVSLVVREIR